MKRSRGLREKEEVVVALRMGVDALSVSSSNATHELVCRDLYVDAIIDFLKEPVQHTMQVFGMPGTGKTATVHRALAKLASLKGEKPTAVFLNGYVVQKSTDVYWTLNTHLTKARLGCAENCPPEQCAGNIERRFRHGWGKDPALCVIVIDEMDKVLEKHPKGLFKIIDWLSLPNAKCKLITISNSMELAVDAKTKSRLDNTRQLVFSPYGFHELRTILLDRVGKISPKLFADQAVNLLCRQTASHYGDVRRLLQSASAALCGVLLKLEEERLEFNRNEGIVSVKEIHGVVRQIFHDRFVEFIRTVRTPVLFIAIVVLAKEAEDQQGNDAYDQRLSLERLFVKTQAAQRRCMKTENAISRARFVEVMELLRQVALVDISIGEERIPVTSATAVLEYTDDVFVSLLQPHRTVVDSCALNEEFGATLGPLIL